MTDIVRRARLFIGSYALLFVLLALRFTTPWLEWVCGALALIGFLDTLWIIFKGSAQTVAEPIAVAEITDVGPEVAGYLATYLLPFLTVAKPSDRDLVAYGIFLLVTGLIYVRSEMAQINPTLYIFGRRVAHVRTDHGWDGYVVVRSSVRPDMVIRTVPLNRDIRVEVRSKQT